jgi:class 3 adenylate cyclase
LRATLGDDVVDTAIAVMRAQLDAMPEARTEHERRLVTVVFADTVDSTRIFQGLDPEEMMAIMDGALEALAEPVRSHGGRVVKFMGDGLLAIFGLHRTRENDAEMAVRAGLDMLRAARAIASDVQDRYSIKGFDIRIGVNTGLVVTGGVTDADDTIIGAAVNLASRIETAAPSGGLLVSQSTYRQVRDRFELQPVGTIQAKGFPEPVPVHLVTGERAKRSRQPSGGIDDVDLAMVGRRHELELLLDTAAETASSGRGHTVTVFGEAGVGKSRLVSEFEARLLADRPVTAFRAGALIENVDVPYGLIRDLFERSFDIHSNDAPTSVREKLASGLGSHLADGTSHAAKVAAIARLLGYTTADDEGSANPQHDRNRAVAHIVEYFRGAASSDTVVLVFEDLQWADEGSLAVVRDLLEGLSEYPVLTLVLTRPELLDAHGDWAMLPGHKYLEIEPLSDADTESLLNSMLRRIDRCPPQLRERLLEHAGGIPYYLEELVMMCLDDGVIEADGPTWTVQMDRMEAMRVPTTLTGHRPSPNHPNTPSPIRCCVTQHMTNSSSVPDASTTEWPRTGS